MKRRSPPQRILALLLALGGLASSLGLTVHDPSCAHHGGPASEDHAAEHAGDGIWLGMAHAGSGAEEHGSGHAGGAPEDDCRCAELCALVGGPVAPAPAGHEASLAADPAHVAPVPVRDEGIPSSPHLRLQPLPTGPPVRI